MRPERWAVVDRHIEDLLVRDAPVIDSGDLHDDKGGNTAYFDEALRPSRPGTLIIADDTIRAGAFVDPGAGTASR